MLLTTTGSDRHNHQKLLLRMGPSQSHTYSGTAHTCLAGTGAPGGLHGRGCSGCSPSVGFGLGFRVDGFRSEQVVGGLSQTALP